jgi:DNA-binding NarL/FixJ family response regulator
MDKQPVCRTLIADDHPIALSGLDFLLSHEDGIEIIGHARDGEEALELCGALKPDLLVLDLQLPKMNGLVVLEMLVKMPERPLILIISGHSSGLNFKQALDLGAEGLVSKEDQPEEVLAAIRALRSGENFLSTIVRDLVQPLSTNNIGSSNRYYLTPREREVLTLLAEGLSNEDIGKQLNISPMTAKKHRENLMRKLGISTAVQATRIAARLGLLKIN